MLTGHGVEAGAHFTVGLILGCQFIPGNQWNRLVRHSFGHQDRAFDAEFVEAGIGQVLQVRLQLGCRGR